MPSKGRFVSQNRPNIRINMAYKRNYARERILSFEKLFVESLLWLEVVVQDMPELAGELSLGAGGSLTGRFAIHGGMNEA